MSLNEQKCKRLYQKYHDTVAVSVALYDLFRSNPLLGKFVGESHQLFTFDDEELTPDISTSYEANSKGLVFEIKYSIGASVKDVLLSAKRYRNAVKGWPSGAVEHVDVVLVCSAEDTQIVSSAIQELIEETADPFFSSEGFAVWQWIVSSTREEMRPEAMWLQPVMGATRNSSVEQLIHSAGGIQISEDVLTHLRFQHMFVRDKPPVQFTIIFLTHHILPKTEKESYEISLDTIYQRANSFFPPWWESAEKTVQVKRQWIKEALEMLVEMKLVEVGSKEETYRVPSALLRKHNALNFFCKKLARISRRRRRVRGRVARIRRIPSRMAEGMPTLEPFLK